MNVTCEVPPLWNVADYNQIKYKILNFQDYVTHTDFIENPNTFCYGAWQSSIDTIIISNQSITDHISLLIAYGDYNASAQGYIYRGTGTTVHEWEEDSKYSNESNFIKILDNDNLYVNDNSFTIPIIVENDFYDLQAFQLKLSYPYEFFELESIRMHIPNSDIYVEAKINLDYQTFVNTNTDFVASNHNGIINIMFTPSDIDAFNMLSDDATVFLTFANNHKSNNISIEEDFYLTGLYNVLVEQNFNELENTSFTMSSLKNKPSKINNFQLAKEHFNSIRIFPNPAQDFIFVEFNIVNNCELHFSIYNILGIEVLNINNQCFGTGKQKIKIPTANLEKGHYFIQIINAEKSIEVFNLPFLIH